MTAFLINPNRIYLTASPNKNRNKQVTFTITNKITIDNGRVYRGVTVKFYTWGESAKAAGVSKTTIFKAIKSGRISFKEKTSEGYKIDPSELHRVFPIITDKPSKGNVIKNDKVTEDNTKGNVGIQAEVSVLREMLEREKENSNYLKDQIGDLQKDRDHWRQQATYLLEDKREKKEADRSWFKRFFKS